MNLPVPMSRRCSFTRPSFTFIVFPVGTNWKSSFVINTDCLPSFFFREGRCDSPLKNRAYACMKRYAPLRRILGGHLKQPWRELAVLELAVLLVHRCLHTGQGKRMVTERAEVAVLCHLAVVEKPLTANPAI